MWVLIFVVAAGNHVDTGAAAVNQEFISKENCMFAQQQLLTQAKARETFVLNNVCIPK